MKSKITYRDYYVAFLDILGFSNIVKKQGAEYIHKIFTNVRKAKKYVKNDRGGKKTEETKFYFFSDTIVCAIPASEENGKHHISVAAPILCQGDILGGVLLLAEQPTVPTEAERKLAQTAAAFLGKQMES